MRVIEALGISSRSLTITRISDNCVRLVESQSEAQRGVDLLQFVETHVADKLPETLGSDGGGLFGEYLGRFVTDGDCGSKDARRR